MRNLTQDEKARIREVCGADDGLPVVVYSGNIVPHVQTEGTVSPFVSVGAWWLKGFLKLSKGDHVRGDNAPPATEFINLMTGEIVKR